MIGRGNNYIMAIPPLKHLDGARIKPTHEKAFLDLFGSSTDQPQDDATLGPIITSRIAGRLPNDLNKAFTLNELEQAPT